MRTSNELIGNSLHLLNVWEQFFESYSKNDGKFLKNSDKIVFEMYRKNTKCLMKELKTFLENN